MKKGCLISLLIGVVLLGMIIYGMITAFDPVYSKAEIKQKIGGVLICNAIYSADHHNGQYRINYKYKNPSGRVFEIGNGTYTSRVWKQDEQLMNFGKWVILKTGGRFDCDKVIISDLKNKKSTEYEFSADSIEREVLWKSSDTHSLLNYCCAESFVKRINNGKIDVLYKFRVDEKNVDKMGSRKLKYEIDSINGKVLMTSITK